MLINILRAHWTAVLLLVGIAVAALLLFSAMQRRAEEKNAQKKRAALQQREPYASLEDMQIGMETLHTHDAPMRRPHSQDAAEDENLSSLQSGKQALQDKNLLDDDVFIPDESMVNNKFASVVPTQAFADGKSLAECAVNRRQPHTDADTGSVREEIRKHKQEIDPQSNI